MNFILQVALTFFLIQFLVVFSIVVVALLFAQPEVPLFSLGACREALAGSFAFVSSLPRRAIKGSQRLASFVHNK